MDHPIGVGDTSVHVLPLSALLTGVRRVADKCRMTLAADTSFKRSIVLAERSVPRYASYPTAPHFSKEVTRAQMREWLGLLTGRSTLSLYLHVPFCKSLCHYCGCHTKAMRQDAPLDSYAATMVQENAANPSGASATGACSTSAR